MKKYKNLIIASVLVAGIAYVGIITSAIEMVIALTILVVSAWGFILLTRRIYKKGLDHIEKKEVDSKTLLRNNVRAFVLLTILTLITIAVFIFGVVQRIVLEVENASLKQQIETYEANAAEAKKSADKAYERALKASRQAMAHADSVHNQYLADSIKNANQ